MRLATTYLNERIELFEGIRTAEGQRDLIALSRLYNRSLGPVTSVLLHRPDLLDLTMYCSSCNHSPISALIPDLVSRPPTKDPMLIPGGGKGATTREALRGALGEAAERLLSVLHFQAAAEELEWATHEELIRHGRRALGPEELPLFAPEQYARDGFRYVPFRPDIRLRWIEGRDLLSGGEVLAPAQLVLLYYKRPRAEPPIGYPTSGGLGFHCDHQHAVLHGLYEFIERDAINVRWVCRLAPQRVDIDLMKLFTEEWGLRGARLSTPSIESVKVYLNTVEVPIPVLTVVAFDNARQECAFLAGGGAAGERNRALGQALFELGQTRTVLRSGDPGLKRTRVASSTSEMTDFLDAAIYFGYESNRHRLSWYTEGKEEVSWNDVPSASFPNEAAEYVAAEEWLRASALNPVVFEFSGACWPGVSVVRVLVPELTPAFVPAYPYLGHPRYYHLPSRLGLAARKLEFHDLNPDPVPFP